MPLCWFTEDHASIASKSALGSRTAATGTTIAITMDIYSHLMPNMQGEAAAAVDGAMRAAINKRTDDVG
jgi:hypothetical protein